MKPITEVIGVINLSPESRNRHTVVSGPEEALALARSYRSHGVRIVDVGAQSSHYQARTLSPQEEMHRLLPAVEKLAGDGFVVSVDTWKPEVAEAAVRAGARIVNDTGGLQDPRMLRVVAEQGVPAILTYIEARNPHEVGEILVSPDKPKRIADWLRQRVEQLAQEGITEVIVDPGIALNYRGDYQAYTRMQIEVIRSLDLIRRLGRPVMVPIPRKAEDHRVIAYITLAVEHGADFIRVHDVAWAADLVALLNREPLRRDGPLWD